MPSHKTCAFRRRRARAPCASLALPLLAAPELARTARIGGVFPLRGASCADASGGLRLARPASGARRHPDAPLPPPRWHRSDRRLRATPGAVRVKKTLAKAMKQNRQVPQWIRFRTGNTVRCLAARPPSQLDTSCVCPRASQLTSGPLARVLRQIRYNNKRRHWRRTKLGL